MRIIFRVREVVAPILYIFFPSGPEILSYIAISQQNRVYREENSTKKTLQLIYIRTSTVFQHNQLANVSQFIKYCDVILASLSLSRNIDLSNIKFQFYSLTRLDFSTMLAKYRLFYSPLSPSVGEYS